MQQKLNFILCTPNHQEIFEDIDMVTVPGIEGDIGIIENRAPLVTVLRSGIISVFKENNIEKLYVDAGFIDVTSDQCLVLAEHFDRLDDIDLGALQSRLQDINDEISIIPDENSRETLIEAKTLIQAKIEIIKNLNK